MIQSIHTKMFLKNRIVVKFRNMDKSIKIKALLQRSQLEVAQTRKFKRVKPKYP